MITPNENRSVPTNEACPPPPALRDPLSAEKFTSENGERWSKVEYGLPDLAPVVASVDALIKGARECPETLVIPMPWHFLLPWLDSPEAELQEFWVSYRTPEAEMNRKRAVTGPQAPNRQKERVIVGLARNYRELSQKKDGLRAGDTSPLSLLAQVDWDENQRAGILNDILKDLADWVLHAVFEDQDAPKRLHQILKSSKLTKSEYGDQPNCDHRIFNAFVAEIVMHLKLPTKKTVRTKAGFGDEAGDRSTAAAAFRRMGLSGLPRS